MSVDTEPHSGADAPPHADEAREPAAPPLDDVLAAGVGLFGALRRVATALAALLLAEARLLRASVGVVVVGSIALVAVAVSLWACVVALIGWGFALATGSTGIALGLLVLLHIVLWAGLWWMVKRALRRASFPGTRSELRTLGGELRGHLDRFQRAAPGRDREAAP